MNRTRNPRNRPWLILLSLCLLAALPVCNQVEDKILEHERAEDIEYSPSQGCDPDAADACAAYNRCTGILLTDCLRTVCDQLDQEARACILAVESCEQIRQCLPQQGDGGIFEEDDDDDAADDDDDVTDDDDATEEELLKNRDFDLGPTPAWVESSSGEYELIQHQDDVSETDAQTPGYLVYMGGYNNAEDSLYQVVSLPATAKNATLSCYVKILTYESGAAEDILRVRLRNSAGTNLLDLAQYSNLDAVSEWTEKTWNAAVSSWAGQQVQFYISATNDDADTTSFFVDTCSFLVTF